MKRIRLFSAALAAMLFFGVGLLTVTGAEDGEPTSRAMTKGELRNEFCPMKGDLTVADQFLAYADEKAKIFARIYFCCEDCTEMSKGADLKALYSQVYLTKADGSSIAYGKTRMEVKNANCPVTGESVASGEKISYNGVSIEMCCPMCAEEFASDPDKYLHNVNGDIDKAMALLKEKE